MSLLVNQIRIKKKHRFSPFDRKKGARDNYPTPQELYEELDKEFQFDHDPCPLNPKGLRQQDGLGAWGKRNYVNPPYSNKEPWIKRAIEEQKRGNLTVMLLPVDTSTKWFHDLILPNAEIRWLRGRLRFQDNQPAKFASMIAIFKPKNAEKLEVFQK